MRRFGWGVLLGVAIALPGLSAGAQTGYADLGNHPLAEAAELLAERRILSGTSMACPSTSCSAWAPTSRPKATAP